MLTLLSSFIGKSLVSTHNATSELEPVDVRIITSYFNNFLYPAGENKQTARQNVNSCMKKKCLAHLHFHNTRAHFLSVP